jgi:hypothetical protein
MGGRYLLIEFDDDAAADRLREQIDSATRKGKKFRVVGLFARPGRACQCVPRKDQRAKDAVQRGGRFGWWLCTTCGKPRFGNHNLINILKPKDVIEPPAFEGVDINFIGREQGPLSYIRHAGELTLVTYPERVTDA